MKHLNGFLSSTGGFALFLAGLIIVFLLVVGLGPDALPYPPSSEYSDAVVSHWPNALYLQENLRAGYFPEWRDLLMSGQPFAANPLNKALYPLQWLVLLFPVTLHLNFMIAFHLVLAGVGMRIFAQCLNFKVSTANITGIAYVLTPRLVAAVGAGHLDVVYAAAWLSWLLWATHRLVTTDKRLWTQAIVLSVIAASCFLADIRISLFCFVMAFGYGLWAMWQFNNNLRRFILPTITSILLMLGLTAFAWLPLFAIAPQLSRNGLTAQDAAVFSLIPGQLISLITPDRGGFHETMLYVGIAIFLLAIIGFVRSPRRHWFWAAVVVISAIYALGDHGILWPLLVQVAPPLLWLRVPSRIWILGVGALIILAGYGLEALTDRGVQRRLLKPVAVALIGGATTCGFLSTQLPLRSGAGIVAIVGLLAVAGLMLISPHLSAPRLILIAGVMITIDLIWMDVTLIKGRSNNEWLGQYASLGQALVDAKVTRLYSPDYSLPQQVAAYWHIPQLGGVDPFQLRDYVNAFEKATGTHASGYSVTLPAFEKGNIQTANRNAIIDANALAQWNISHVLAGFPINNADLRFVKRIGELYLYQNTKWQSETTIIWDGPNRFTATNNTTQPVRVVAWSPGWNIPSTNGAIVVEPGQTITANYSTPNLGFALLIMAISIAATITIPIAERRG